MAKNLFNSVQMPGIGKNRFDLSYDHKLSLNMGDLVPIHIQEVVPGDSFSQGCESMIRLAPMLAPVMHKVDVTTHFFFVPTRIIWPNWEDFISPPNSASVPPALPYYPAGTSFTNGSLVDYMGLPTVKAGDPVKPLPKFSVLPFAAYTKIWMEYYRDQNLQQTEFLPCVDGDNTTNFMNQYSVLRKRAWQHDYYTSALPFAQKGQPVSLPVGLYGDVPVRVNPEWIGSNQAGTFIPVDLSVPPLGAYNIEGDYDGSDPEGKANISALSNQKVIYNPGNSLIADTSDLNADSATINDLRRAIKLQEFLEKDARGGTRYIEKIKAHFGVTSPDARLQRPEYLGGSKQPVVISEVLQTAGSNEDTPQGNMAGHGISVGSGNTFHYRATEHGFIIGIMSILPKTAYQQGVNRLFSKFDPYDYFWPEFEHIGEQPILNKEIYADNSDGLDNAVFGYTPRYAEYKYNDSRVSGDFKGNLDFWHMGRIFSTRPQLNAQFVVSDPTHRIFAVEDPSVHKIYAHVFHRISASRLMSFYGSPSF